MAAPIALTDDQLAVITTQARMLPRALRSDFLRLVASALRGQRLNDRVVALAASAAVHAITAAHSREAS